MEFTKKQNGEETIYELSGRLDTQSSPEFQEVLDEGFEKGENKLVFDCKGIDYMSSAGLRTILYAKKRIDNVENGDTQGPKGYLKLINVSDDIIEVFAMTGFDEFLSINEN